MGVLADSGLLVQAAPALVDGGWETARTEGMSWEWKLDELCDASGAPLAYGTLTVSAVVRTRPGGSVVVTLDTEWSTVNGQTRLRIYKDDAATVGLANGQRSRRCYWGITITDGVDRLPICSPTNSVFHIETED